MKRFIFAVLFAATFATTSNAQSIRTDENGNYHAVKAANVSADSTATGKTYTDTKGKVYPVYLSAKGKPFVPRTSKSGKYYRQYLKLD